MDGMRVDLQNSFEELGIIVDKPILDMCLEICKRHDISDAEDFVDGWMAYSMSKLNGENPTISYLKDYETDEYEGRRIVSHYKDKECQKGSLVVYEANNMEVDKDDTLDILKVYDESLSKGKNSWGLRTPENSKKPKRKSSPQAVFSPASFSPTITSLSSKYTSRTNSGEVVFPYKNEELKSTRGNTKQVVRIDRLNRVDIQRFMNFDLIDALDYADETIDKLGSILTSKFNLEEAMPVRYKHPSPFITIGRIACDADGRLNAKSVVLEGSRDLSLGETIPLDLGGVEKYSIFPGQVVAVEGVNITGDKLMAKKIYCDASPEPPKENGSRGSLNIIIAAGPHTPSDSMTYQPLLDLIDIVASEEPDVLILTGPFIDYNHPVILEDNLAETFEDLFRKIVDQIMRPLQNKKTQVVMLPSYKDCAATCVYPTPQFTLKDKVYRNLHLLPDPSVMSIEGVVIAVTSTDSLMHIGKEEISNPGYSTDRLSRLAGHIISQRCFYPLSPAAGVPVDPLFMQYAKLNVKPHILILPSDLRYFMKDVSGCVVINPERLAKGIIGGTYARISLTTTGLVGSIIRI